MIGEVAVHGIELHRDIGRLGRDSARRSGDRDTDRNIPPQCLASSLSTREDRATGCCS